MADRNLNAAALAGIVLAAYVMLPVATAAAAGYGVPESVARSQCCCCVIPLGLIGLSAAGVVVARRRRDPGDSSSDWPS
jgi:hypothetical protein